MNQLNRINSESIRLVNQNNLKKLRFGNFFWGEVCTFRPSNQIDLAELGDCLGENHSLTSIEVSDYTGFAELLATTSGVSFLGGIERNKSIHELELCHCRLYEGVGCDIVTMFEQKKKNSLTSLSLWCCDVRNGGFDLVLHLINQNTIKHISIRACSIDDEIVMSLTKVLRSNHSLETLRLDRNWIGRDGCNSFAVLLKEPNCNLHTLDLEGNHLDDAGLVVLADALLCNRKLANLHLNWNDQTSQDGLNTAFSRVLCDSSSANATYSSNHVLERLSKTGCTSDKHLSMYLTLNRSCTDKKHVAIKKILQCHANLSMKPLFEYGLGLLPYVANWFDRAKACSENETKEDAGKRYLCAIYSFIRGMPWELKSHELRMGSTTESSFLQI